MEANNDSRNYGLVLPTPTLPPALASNRSQPQSQFILGYRNVITCTTDGLRWGLVKSASHCARVFSFALTEAETYNIQQLRGEDEYIENVGENFIVLKIEKAVNRPRDLLTSGAVRDLLDAVGGLNKITLNLLKNAFESFGEYARVIPVELELELQSNCPRRQLDITERVRIELNGKKLSGANLMQVPVVVKETGDCRQDQTLALKLVEH